ncbi:MAG: DEAD/DEAH box helicase [Rhodobacteraceae bacterium]|nr:DEAD/DEAH box helicase [Paracoccaceae bacterium]
MSFDSLGLSEKVLEAVKAAGYTEPTSIQSGAIPHVLQRRDILGIAQTGTGKTASFTLPMLTLLEKGRARARMPRTLILEPTRELAAQVEENFVRYGVNHKLNVALLIGGTSFADQDRKIDRGADVLIATPGRLLDHVERGKLMLQGVEILVIDEADRMLDMGFIPDIERICKLIPFTRQTLFFSATMPPEIQKLTETFLQNPERIEVARTSSTNEKVTQHLKASDRKDSEKRAALRELLEQAEDLQNAIIFCNRKRDIATLFRSLERHGYNVGALHGDMDQRVRMTMLENFRNGNIKILVASDVAARGLDIPEVSHVYNYDVPSHAEDYVHRIGRTGRGGRSGAAYTIVTKSEQKALKAILALIQRDVEWIGEPLDFDAEETAREKPTRRRRSAKTEKPAAEASEAAPSEAEPKAEAPVEVAAQAPQEAEAAEKKPAPRNRNRNRSNSDEQPTNKRAKSSRQPENGNNRNQQRERSNGRKDEPAFGEGVHIPAFLLREPRPKKTIDVEA